MFFFNFHQFSIIILKSLFLTLIKVVVDRTSTELPTDLKNNVFLTSPFQFAENVMI